jgi:hypothetical protein
MAGASAIMAASANTVSLRKKLMGMPLEPRFLSAYISGFGGILARGWRGERDR